MPVTVVGAALSMAQAGAYVFPVDSPLTPTCSGLPTAEHDPTTCTARGKHPCVKFTQHATRDPVLIAEALRAGMCNYGIATAPSGLIVLDVDDRGALDAYLTRNNVSLPATFSVTTGRGVHLYLRCPTDARVGNAPLVAGVDVRAGSAGYVVGPGSLHASGATYGATWDVEVAQAPDWLVTTLEALAARRDSRDIPTGLIGNLEVGWRPSDWLAAALAAPAVDGERHQRFYAMVGACKGEGLSVTQTVTLLMPWCARVGKFVGRVEAEVLRAWGKADPRVEPEPVEPMSPFRAITDMLSYQSAAGRVVTRRAAREVAIMETDWLWAGRIPVGMLTLLAGRESIGKSTIALDLAARLTRGALVGRFEGMPRGVGVVAGEDSFAHVIKARLVAAGADDSRVFEVSASTPHGHDMVSMPEDINALGALCRDADVSLLIVDPLMSVINSALDTHKDRDVRRALDPLVHFASESGVAVLGLIHVNKSTSGDALNSIMGSRAFSAVARSVLYAIEDPDEENVYVLGHAKSNLGPRQASVRYAIEQANVPGAGLTLHRTSRVVWGADDPRGVAEVLTSTRDGRRNRPTGELAARVLAWVAAQARVVSAAEVLGEINDVSIGTVRMCLSRMVQRGELVQPLHGHYAVSQPSPLP